MDRITDTLEQDLIDALNEIVAQEQADYEANTITTVEFGDAMNLGRGAALRRLKKLMRSGVIERTKVQRANIDGVLTTVCGWRYVAD